jgi:hypothetical protein
MSATFADADYVTGDDWDLPDNQVPDTEAEEETQQEKPDFRELFDAPDWASWLKVEETAVSREYRKKCNSFLKMLMTGCINTNNFPDAAAIIDRGPGLSAAVGQLAASNDKIRHGIDIVMAPSSPIAQFIGAALPLGAQLWRNHEVQFAELPANIRKTRAERKAAKTIPGHAEKPPKFTIRLGKRIRIPIRVDMKVRWKFFTGGLRSQAQDPNLLATRVFSDKKVQAQLQKMGIILQKAGPDD